MNSLQLKAQIVRKEFLTSDTIRWTIKAPEIACLAKPGQFVMVRINENFDPLLRRPFSIHQKNMKDGTIQILFKVVGKGTRRMAQAGLGELIDLLGPLGQGFTIKNEKAFLIGGGIGVAPLLFLAQAIIQTYGNHGLKGQSDEKMINVYLGARDRENILCQADFENLGVNLFVATEDGSTGHRGLITELLERDIPNNKPGTIYACGPNAMLKIIAEKSGTYNWPCQISLEAMMACGIEACLGCTMSRAGKEGYLHVCKDGPVVEAREVAWK